MKIKAPLGILLLLCVALLSSCGGVSDGGGMPSGGDTATPIIHPQGGENPVVGPCSDAVARTLAASGGRTLGNEEILRDAMKIGAAAGAEARSGLRQCCALSQFRGNSLCAAL